MLFVVVALGLGLAYYWLVQRHKIGILAEHAAAGAPVADRAGGPA